MTVFVGMSKLGDSLSWGEHGRPLNEFPETLKIIEVAESPTVLGVVRQRWAFHLETSWGIDAVEPFEVYNHQTVILLVEIFSCWGNIRCGCVFLSPNYTVREMIFNLTQWNETSLFAQFGMLSKKNRQPEGQRAWHQFVLTTKSRKREETRDNLQTLYCWHLKILVKVQTVFFFRKHILQYIIAFWVEIIAYTVCNVLVRANVSQWLMCSMFCAHRLAFVVIYSPGLTFACPGCSDLDLPEACRLGNLYNKEVLWDWEFPVGLPTCEKQNKSRGSMDICDICGTSSFYTNCNLDEPTESQVFKRIYK